MKAQYAISSAYLMKSQYRRNLALGFGIAAMLNLAVVVTTSRFISADHIQLLEIGPTPNDSIVIIIPPHLSGTSDQPKFVKTNQKQKQDIDVIPIPVPDDDAPPQTDILNQHELSLLDWDASIEGLGANILIDSEKVAESLIPPPTTFIPVDELPMQVSLARPVFPELARKAGENGKVYLRVFVDKGGTVRAVQVDKATNPGIGFEEAAIEAAWKTTWRPAITNGIPVGVWVSYTVEFRIQ